MARPELVCTRGRTSNLEQRVLAIFDCPSRWTVWQSVETWDCQRD